MIDSISEKLKQAQIKKEQDDEISHSEKVRKAAINYMKANNVNETPVIDANGYKVKFSNPSNLKMWVDGKEVSNQNIDYEINKVDLTGPEMQKERDKKRIKDISKKELNNVASIAKVSAVRSAVSAPARMADSGQRTVGALLRGLWGLLQKAI